jgi:hypothetical protein
MVGCLFSKMRMGESLKGENGGKLGRMPEIV